MRLETPKRNLWQTVKTQTKYPTRQYFIRVITVFQHKIDLIIITCDSSIGLYAMDQSDVIESNSMENFIGIKGLNLSDSQMLTSFSSLHAG